jgi:hypothetical protein
MYIFMCSVLRSLTPSCGHVPGSEEYSAQYTQLGTSQKKKKKADARSHIGAGKVRVW